MTTHDNTSPLRPSPSAKAAGDKSDSEGQAGWKPENPYEEEAKARWGHTDAWKQSQERVGKMSKEDMAKIKQAGEDLTKKIADLMDHDPASAEVQALIAQHYAGLRAFYEPSLEMYRGLGDMYVNDHRFTAFYDKFKPGLAVFMRDAMHAYCDAQEAAGK